MISNFFDTQQKEKLFSQLKGSEKRNYKTQKSQIILRARTETDQDQRIKEEQWDQRELDIRKSFSKITLQKRNSIDSLTLICFLAILFVLAFHFAPNQFYEPNLKK